MIIDVWVEVERGRWAHIMVKTKGDGEESTDRREREREKLSSKNLETKENYGSLLCKKAVPRDSLFIVV